MAQNQNQNAPHKKQLSSLIAKAFRVVDDFNGWFFSGLVGVKVSNKAGQLRMLKTIAGLKDPPNRMINSAFHRHHCMLWIGEQWVVALEYVNYEPPWLPNEAWLEEMMQAGEIFRTHSFFHVNVYSHEKYQLFFSPNLNTVPPEAAIVTYAPVPGWRPAKVERNSDLYDGQLARQVAVVIREVAAKFRSKHRKF